MSANLLAAVVAAARKSADEREAVVDRGALGRTLADRRPDGTRFVAALRQGGLRVIAECKRRSPSRGVLRHDYDPVAIARAYQAAGAASISVITEPTFFDGSLDHLRAVRAAVTLPLLRKDFIVTDFQIEEAAASGADAVLLIVAALDQAAMKALLARATSLGLATLVEVHDEDELVRATDLGAEVIGVNSRDLRTLEVRTGLFDDIAARLPRSVIAVAESGLRTRSDLQRLHALRFDAFLIGERFMTAADPGRALSALITDSENGS
jgi:indole-3-glycerol phosphate synthase